MPYYTERIVLHSFIFDKTDKAWGIVWLITAIRVDRVCKKIVEKLKRVEHLKQAKLFKQAKQLK